MSLPKHAAHRLHHLIQKRDIALLRLGIVSVQFDNEQIIPLLTQDPTNNIIAQHRPKVQYSPASSSSILKKPQQNNNSKTVVSGDTTQDCNAQTSANPSATSASKHQLENCSETTTASTITSVEATTTTIDTTIKLPELESHSPTTPAPTFEITKHIETGVVNQIGVHNHIGSSDPRSPVPVNAAGSILTAQSAALDSLSEVAKCPVTEASKSAIMVTGISSQIATSIASLPTTLPAPSTMVGSNTMATTVLGSGSDNAKAKSLPDVYDDDDEDDKDENEVASEVENQHSSFNIHQLSQLEFTDPIDLGIYENDNENENDILFSDYSLNI